MDSFRNIFSHFFNFDGLIHFYAFKLCHVMRKKLLLKEKALIMSLSLIIDWRQKHDKTF